MKKKIWDMVLKKYSASALYIVRQSLAEKNFMK